MHAIWQSEYKAYYSGSRHAAFLLSPWDDMQPDFLLENIQFFLLVISGRLEQLLNFTFYVCMCSLVACYTSFTMGTQHSRVLFFQSPAAKYNTMQITALGNMSRFSCSQDLVGKNSVYGHYNYDYDMIFIYATLKKYAFSFTNLKLNIVMGW